MGLTANVVANTPILSGWGNEIRDRTVQNFTSATQRSSQWPSPPDGAVSWLADINALQVYDGTTWLPAGPISGTWSPIWRGPGSNATAVTVRGNFHRVGSLVTVVGGMTHGSGTASGTALEMGGLPYRIKTANTVNVVGTGFFKQNTGEYFSLHAEGLPGQTYVKLRCVTVFSAPGQTQLLAAGSNSGGTPFPWAANCEANLTMTYETDQ